MISLVIPARNEEKYIADCLKSLMEQGYSGEYEVIVVDNGSGDSTTAIARDLGARVVHCEDRGSVASVRQVGADAARGEIIIQADADTIYPRHWLSTIACQFDSHREIVALSGRFFYTKPPWWAKIEYSVRYAINCLAVALLRRPLFISGATFAFRREAFHAVKGYHGLAYSADQYGLATRLSKRGKVRYDKNICVFTSPRRVAGKLTIVLIGEVAINLGRWNIYLCQQCLSRLKVFARKTRPGRPESARV